MSVKRPSRVGEILAAEVPAGEVIILEYNSAEVFRLIALGRVELGRREPRRGLIAKAGPVTTAPVRSAFESVESDQVGVGEILPTEVPAGEVIV